LSKHRAHGGIYDVPLCCSLLLHNTLPREGLESSQKKLQLVQREEKINFS